MSRGRTEALTIKDLTYLISVMSEQDLVCYCREDECIHVETHNNLVNKLMGLKSDLKQ